MDPVEATIMDVLHDDGSAICLICFNMWFRQSSGLLVEPTMI